MNQCKNCQSFKCEEVNSLLLKIMNRNNRECVIYVKSRPRIT